METELKILDIIVLIAVGLSIVAIIINICSDKTVKKEHMAAIGPYKMYNNVYEDEDDPNESANGVVNPTIMSSVNPGYPGYPGYPGLDFMKYSFTPSSGWLSRNGLLPWWNSTRFTRNSSWDLRGDIPPYYYNVGPWLNSPLL